MACLLPVGLLPDVTVSAGRETDLLILGCAVPEISRCRGGRIIEEGPIHLDNNLFRVCLGAAAQEERRDGSQNDATQ
jgi:hypothetical protein